MSEITWRSSQRDGRGGRLERPQDELRFDPASGVLVVLERDLGDEDREVRITLTPEERYKLAEIVRGMRTTARGGSESFNKLELLLEDVDGVLPSALAGGEGTIVGVHATEGCVSIHAGRSRGELTMMYVHLSPIDAGAFVRELEEVPA